MNQESSTGWTKQVLNKNPLAVSYFKEQLSCGKTLSKLLIKDINLEAGQLFSYTPKEIDVNKIQNFSWSFSSQPRIEGLGSVDQDCLSDDPLVALEVKPYLLKDKGHLCIFEDANATPKDTFWMKSGKDRLRLEYENEIYYSIDQNQLAEAKKIINQAFSWLLVGVMTGSNGRHFRRKLTSQDLKYFVKNTKEIIVGAYDGDGYLIWEKNNS